MTTITRDQWLAELQRVMTAHDADGMTMREIADVLGVGVAAARERFRKFPELLEYAGRRRIVALGNKSGLSPVYRLRKA